MKVKTFKEFLDAQADQIRAEKAAKESKKNRWIASVSDLIAQTTTWLEEADAKSILTIQSRFVERNEENLGAYSIPCVDIWMGSRVVSIEPIACEVRGPLTTPRAGSWSGRVDFSGQPYSCKVYRLLSQDQGEEWYIVDDKDYRQRLFDRENFDAMMLDLFA